MPSASRPCLSTCAVKSHKPTIAPLDQAVRSDIISQLCDIAVRTKRKITWDRQKATIVGDDEATKLKRSLLSFAPHCLIGKCDFVPLAFLCSTGDELHYWAGRLLSQLTERLLRLRRSRLSAAALLRRRRCLSARIPT